MKQPVFEVTVEATWDSDAKVWVAESNDVPGLVTEADTLEDLERKVLALIPELLEANGGFPVGVDQVPVQLIARRHELIQLRAS